MGDWALWISGVRHLSVHKGRQAQQGAACFETMGNIASFIVQQKPQLTLAVS